MNILFADDEEITEDLITYYKENPRELDLIIDKEIFHKRFLLFVFFIGLTLTIASRLLISFFSADVGQTIVLVLFDILSELGIAIFGGAVVAYLIEYLNNEQYQRNLAFRNKIKGIIDEER